MTKSTTNNNVNVNAQAQAQHDAEFSENIRLAYSRCRRWIGVPPVGMDVENLVQEAVGMALVKYRRLRVERGGWTWTKCFMVACKWASLDALQGRRLAAKGERGAVRRELTGGEFAAPTARDRRDWAAEWRDVEEILALLPGGEEGEELRAIARLLAEGWSYVEIGEAIGVSKSTVGGRVESIRYWLRGSSVG